MAAVVTQYGAALLACLFLACGVFTDAQQLTGIYDTENIRAIDMTKATFTLTCRVENVPKDTNVLWYLEDSEVRNSTLQTRITFKKTDNESVLSIRPVQETDNGTYSCRLENQQSVRADFVVVAKPHVRIPPNHNVVETQKIKIACTVLGKPVPKVDWMYNPNPNPDDKSIANTTVEADEGGRISFAANDAGVEGATLVLKDAIPSDAGAYYCRAHQAKGNLTHIGGTVLRVKDKYAALWPFIGICVEVVVLCAIILVYEKRRTKHTDMEDSDTDNHDQKKS